MPAPGPPQPRFQCFTHGAGWYWRLLGANNRVLARAPHAVDGAEAAALAALAVAALAAVGEIELLAAAGATWRWALLDPQEPTRTLAVSAVGYARRMECVRAATRFRRSAPGAAVSQAPLVTPRHRAESTA